MKKMRFFAMLLALLLLFSACSGGGETFSYEKEGHTHIYGAWYDITSVTCETEGEHICYCKICGTSAVEIIRIEEDIALRAHAFVDTVTPPTESVGGFTRRVCTLCSYTVERTNEVPALYELSLPAEPQRPVSATAQLAFSTETVEGVRSIMAADATKTEVTALPALYLAAALVATEAIAAGELRLTDSVTLTSAIVGGRIPHKSYREGTTVKVSALLDGCLAGESEIAVAALAYAMEKDKTAFEGEFVVRLNKRLQRLGTADTVFGGLSADRAGRSTVFDSATLLWRVLAEETLTARLVSEFSFGTAECVLFFEKDSFRLSAVRRGVGYRVASLLGAEASAELTIYQ